MGTKPWLKTGLLLLGGLMLYGCDNQQKTSKTVSPPPPGSVPSPVFPPTGTPGPYGAGVQPGYSNSSSTFPNNGNNNGFRTTTGAPSSTGFQGGSGSSPGFSNSPSYPPSSSTSTNFASSPSYNSGSVPSVPQPVQPAGGGFGGSSIPPVGSSSGSPSLPNNNYSMPPSVNR